MMQRRRDASIICHHYGRNYSTISTTQHSTMPPLHSESFLQHLENVKSSWKPDSSDDDVGGVPCFGEPTIDPSRMVQNFIVDGDSNWI